MLAFLLLLASTPAQLSDQAQQHAQAGRLEEARKLWEQALQEDPKFFPALFNLGLLEFNRKDWVQAAPLLKRAAAVQPADFNTHYLLGAVYSQAKRTDDALVEWRAALKLKPGHRSLLQLMVVEYGKGRYFQEAADAARQALNPADANSHFLAIKASQDAGDTAAAFAIAKQAAERFPQLARSNFEYGFHLQKVGEVEKAVSYLRRAMELDPVYEEPPFFYGDLLVKQGKSAEAVEPLRRAIGNRKDYIPARVLLARALMNTGKWEEALKELEETIRLEPLHPQPHLLLSQIYFRQGDEAKAKECKDRSLRLRRENPTLLEAVQGRPFPKQ